MIKAGLPQRVMSDDLLNGTPRINLFRLMNPGLTLDMNNRYHLVI